MGTEETPLLTRTQGYANRDLTLHWRLEKHRYQTAPNVREPRHYRPLMGVGSGIVTVENNLAPANRAEEGPAWLPAGSPQHLTHRSRSTCKHINTWEPSRAAPFRPGSRTGKTICAERHWNSSGLWHGHWPEEGWKGASGWWKWSTAGSGHWLHNLCLPQNSLTYVLSSCAYDQVSILT